MAPNPVRVRSRSPTGKVLGAVSLVVMPTGCARPGTQQHRPVPGTAGTRLLLGSAPTLSGAAEPLGEFLRARRELWTPPTSGVRVTGVRRTPACGARRSPRSRASAPTTTCGSNRAGTGTRRGRSWKPSPGPAARRRRHRPPPEPGGRRPRGRGDGRGHRPLGTRQLLDALDLPAFVEDRTFEVLAANRLATALWPSLRVGQNRLRAVFLDEREGAMVLDPEQARAGMVAAFRASVGAGTDDPRVAGWSGNSPSPARSSPGCGRGTTCATWPAGTARLQHPRWVCWNCAARSWPWAGRTGSCSSSTTPNAGLGGRRPSRCSARSRSAGRRRRRHGAYLKPRCDPAKPRRS